MRIEIKIICLVLFLIVLPSVEAWAEDNMKTIESEGVAEISGNRTLDETRNLALQRARRNALEEAVGVDVRGSTVVYNAELINDMVMTGTKGLITNQEVLLNECGEDDGVLVCTVRIRATIKELDRSLDPPFRIKAYVHRPGNKKRSSSAPVFQDGDEVQISLKLNNPGHVTIFSIDQEGNVYQIFPNKYAMDSLVDDGQNFVFPDDSLRAMGLRVRAHTLEGHKKSHESLMIIATTRKMDLLDDMESAPTMTSLMNQLASLDQAVWAQETKGYIVMK